MGLAVSLDTGVTALRAAQLAVDTASNNIANAQTPGYSRERTLLTELGPSFNGPQTGAGGTVEVGLGVDVAGIQGLHDDMLDGQYRGAYALQQGYQASASALQQAQAVFNEPSGTGLQSSLAAFFNGFRDLADQPESLPARSAAIQQGVSLAAQFNQVASQLTQQRTGLDAAVVSDVTQINDKLTEVGRLNAQIESATIAKQNPNTLLDQRDQVLDDLAGLAGVTVQPGANGMVVVTLDGRAVVSGSTVSLLQTVPDPSNGGLSQVQFASDGSAVTFGAGEVQGLLDARDTTVAGALNTLNQLAQALITAVNSQTQAGYGLDGSTGIPFFTGSSAADIAVNSMLLANPQQLATASATGQPGNGDVATAIAGLENAKLMNGNSATIGDAYAAALSLLGSQAAHAQELQQNQTALTQNVDAARQSVSGVSIDEEVANLTQGERAYQAAARVISVSDTMLDTLVNQMLQNVA